MLFEKERKTEKRVKMKFPTLFTRKKPILNWTKTCGYFVKRE